MQDDAIRKALEVAGEAARRKCDTPDCCMTDLACPVSPCMCAREIAAATIAAFLEALPEGTAYTMVPLPLALAAAVRRAAGGGA